MKTSPEHKNKALSTHIVPSHFDDPIGLIGRVLRRGGRHGRFSLWLAGLAYITTPIDILLEGRERRLIADAEAPSLPMVFVCGPPRSGTTIMAQLLCRSNRVSYFTNFTALFPRSPLAATSLIGVMPNQTEVPLTSHYGRVAGLAAPNDGLHLWDRWLGPRRNDPDRVLLRSSHEAMKKFFGGFERLTDQPLVTKNNVLNAVASEVAEALPTARFICMKRDPLQLAQSLLVARSYIHGTNAAPYGLAPSEESLDDPVADVIRQVRYLTEEGSREAASLGAERFRVVSYEHLCARPRDLVAEIAEEWLGTDPSLTSIPASLQVANHQYVDDSTYERLRKGLANGAGIG